MANYNGKYINDLMRDQSKNVIKISVDELIQIYRDDWDDIIDAALYDQFTDKTRAKLTWLKTKEINLIKRVVNTVSLVYKKPATRICFTETKTIDSETQEEIVTMIPDPTYAEMMEDTNLDTKMKQVNRYTNLSNHTMTKIVWRNGKIDYDILLFNNVEVYTHPDDWMRIIAIKYYVGLELPDYSMVGNESNTTASFQKRKKKADAEGMPIAEYNRAFLYTLEDVKLKKEDTGGPNDVVVEKGFIYTFEKMGDKEVLVETEENPYRDAFGNVVLPFVLSSKSEPVDKLLNFTEGNDLRDGNINIALAMIHLNNLLKFQSYKQMYMKVKDKSKVPQDVELDPQTIALIELGEDGKGEIGVLDIQASIDKLWEVIQKRILTIISQYNISPENFTLSATPESGFALMISNMGKLEAREDQIPEYRKLEKNINDVVKIVFNYHNITKKIPYDCKFKVDFAEITFPQSPDEKMKEFAFYKQNNVKTPIDLIMEHNPDLTRAQARERFEENKAINEEMNVGLTAPAQPGEEEEEDE